MKITFVGAARIVTVSCYFILEEKSGCDSCFSTVVNMLL